MVDGLGGLVGGGFEAGTGGAFGRFGGFAIGLAFAFAFVVGAVIGAFCSGGSGASAGGFESLASFT